MPDPMPKLRAIVVADQYFQDRATGKHIISGTFTNLMSPKFPVALMCGVYVSIEDAIPPAQFELCIRLGKSGEAKQIAFWDIKSKEANPEDAIEMGVQLPIQFETEGAHDLLVKHNGIELGSRSIIVKKAS